MKHVKTLILGAGISALSFVHFSKLEDYLIIEKEERAGGLCRSFKVKDSVYDFSGHFLHFKSEEMKKYIFDLVKEHTDAEFKEYDRTSAILLNNDLITYPFQANVHQLPKQQFYNCLLDLYEASQLQTKSAENFGAMVTDTFGKSITELFFRPYNEKLYRTKLEDLDADAMNRFIPKVSFREVIANFTNPVSIGYNNTFLYSVKTGIQGLVDAFQPEKMNIHTSETVARIDVNLKQVHTDKDIYEYEELINTLPLNVFLSLAAFDVQLDHVAVDVYNITFDRIASKKGIGWIYVPDSAVSFYRVGFYDYMSENENAPTSMYVEISRKQGDIPASLDTVLNDLVATGLIDRQSKVAHYQYLPMDPAYVILSTKTEQQLAPIKAELKSKHVHLLGRYGKWTYQSICDNIQDAQDLATTLR